MYNYEEQKEKLFTDQGQRMFLAVRDRVQELLKQTGAVRYIEAVKGIGGDNWLQLACVDRLVELGEIRDVNPKPDATQYRVFVGTKQ